ncbi:MAG TPA: uroporphyrinogen-III C-methyltransferase [Gammaproteobacteria bacterium]|jgi:uroporphyrin-3 C-methyltransferase|nr:uroporphyrinogen-III C-methyltransferase [Gammaproteobacteria bacterium]
MENDTQIPSPPPKKNRFPWKALGILISAFAVIVLVYVMYAAYFSYVQLQKMQIDESMIFASDIEHLKTKMDFLQKSLNESQSSQAQHMQDVTDSLQKLEKITGDEKQFVIADADYLVKLANQNINLEHNVPDAINLLKKADQTLQGLNNAKALAVREALAKDIASLQSAPVMDITGIFMRLNALSGELQRLPLITKLPETKENSAGTVQHENLSWWKRGLQNTWDSLRSLVVVRYNMKGRMPLISPGQETFLYGLMTTEVMHAEWGLLHGNNEIYQASLMNVKKYVEEYFISNASTTVATIQELNALLSMNVQPVSKDISDSMQAISALKKGE